ncbi:MAG: RNA 3'-terminal phosphate cyclase [Chthoniobacteraceae bacterium]
MAVELHRRGGDRGRRVVAHLAGVHESIARRAFEHISQSMSWPEESFSIRAHLPEHGPGLALVAAVESDEIVETFTAFGERGIRVEAVANGLVQEIRDYLCSEAPVGEHLADQLLPPMALAGAGAFRAIRLSRHTRTNIGTIEKFLPIRFRTRTEEENPRSGVLVEIEAL